MKSWTTPTLELVDRAIASTTDSEQRRYFFYKLQNPLWVKPLWEKGFFRKAPELIPTGDGGFQIPLWPESQYLARVAKESAADVVEIVTKIQTGNPRVLEDIVDIALAIESADISKKLYPQASSFAENKFANWSSQKLGKLVVHWARHGAKTEALKLAEKLVCLCPDPRKKKKEEERKADPNAWFTHLEPRSPRDLHVYKKVLDEDITQLAEIFPWETAQVLTRSLAAAITLSFHEPDKSVPYDCSDIWCQHLKEGDIYEHDAKSYLTHALTNACEVLLGKQPESMDELDKLLRQQSWYFFRRLRWYLYAKYPQLSRKLIKSDAINYEGYDDGEYGFELASMLRAATEAQIFTDDELQHIFEKVEQGPDIEGFKKWYGDKITDELIQGRREYFFIKQLFPFAPVLQKFPAYWSKYQLYTKKHKEPQLSDYFKYRRGSHEAKFIPDKSPITIDELKAKSNEELLNFLNNWKATSNGDDFNEPNSPGLAKAFSEILKEQPDRLLELADKMTISNPTCLRDYFYFLVERTKQKQSLPWEKIINLCQWVVEQPQSRRESNQHNWRSGEPDFAACRQAIANLFQHGSNEYPDSIPWESREKVFVILKQLCTDYDSRLEGESFGKDFLTQAINSVRGDAVHALVDHALWIKRHLNLATHGMEKMPEVQQLLENRLNPANEKSLAVHAVFGLLAPWLCHLDADWFANLQSQIFPAEPELSERWFAAWKTFVSWNQPNAQMFKVLKHEYEVAVQRLELLRKDEESHLSAANALGEHLITFYWWKLFPLSGAESLLEKYLTLAKPKERAHVMNYVGRAMENTKDLPKDVEAFIMEYWQHRFETLKQDQNREESSEELSAFAWWFRSGKLDVTWCLKQLKELLAFTPLVHETYFLLEDLAKVAPAYPVETVTCLKLLVGKISRDRYVFLDEKHVKEIMNVAIQSKSQEAVTIAEKAQDELLRLGRFEYKEIVQSTQP